MSGPSRIYRQSLALLTDLYQLTMAYGYWRTGLAERRAVFHLFFRQPPFAGQFALACGLGYVIDFLRDVRFTADDLQYLASLTGTGQQPLFEPAFLEYLGQFTCRCDVDAVPEGTAVFAQQPLVRVQGPLLQCQILETALLTMINFQTLVATKAARVCRAAAGQPVLEFGLRRAQGIDGGLAASRAAYVGGCAATSNVLAGELFGIPVRGTHAHSWVMAFDNETEAFRAYAAAMPHNCVLLVDTYDTLQGVGHAVHVAIEMRRAGRQLLGIRLDSGDLLRLSREARRLLDEAGLTEVAIVASGDLDEYSITQLRSQGAAINVWGVGTRLVTAYDQPALGGVYKLGALQDPHGRWQYKLKLSEDGTKRSEPGILQVRRLRDDRGRFLADVIYDELQGIATPLRLVPLAGISPSACAVDFAAATDLLVPIFRAGELVYDPPTACAARSRALEQLNALDDGVLRIDEPQPYLVGWERQLHEVQARLAAPARASRAAT